MQIMSTIARIAGRIVAPLALMAAIFWLSAQPDLDSGLALDFVLRKLAHAFAFGLLAVLWWRALRPTGRRALPIAIAIALGYGIFDEYHQSFVEGRSGTAVDVAIDSVGIGVAGVLCSSYESRWPSRRRGRATKVHTSPDRTRSANPEAS
jgi:hypothetical protein